MIDVASQLQKTFGARVRTVRMTKGISQAELAKRLEMHQPDLCDLEKGRHAPTLETVERVAVVLGVAPELLVSQQLTTK